MGRGPDSDLFVLRKTATPKMLRSLLDILQEPLLFPTVIALNASPQVSMKEH